MKAAVDASDQFRCPFLYTHISKDVDSQELTDVPKWRKRPYSLGYGKYRNPRVRPVKSTFEVLFPHPSLRLSSLYTQTHRHAFEKHPDLPIPVKRACVCLQRRRKGAYLAPIVPGYTRQKPDKKHCHWRR